MNHLIRVKLGTVNDVKHFVDAAEKYPHAIKVRANEYVVSGKSIMGMFSLDLSNPVAVELSDENGAQAFIDEIKPYVC